MIENIKYLFNSIPHGMKSKAIKAVSEATGASFGTVKTHWLAESGGFSTPEKQQEKTVNALQNFILVNDIEVQDKETAKSHT